MTSSSDLSQEKITDELVKCFGKEIITPKNVTDRIKTFEDALKELGEDHLFVGEYETLIINGIQSVDILAYLKLRIICAALNEGWKPQLTEDKWRYYPWFHLYTKKELNNLDEEERNEFFLFGSCAAYGEYYGFGSSCTLNAPSHSGANIGSLLCFKNSELATYCGKQFASIWADFYLIRKSE